jgi:LDH2 family malate/lactate/ureidoglycolate dehydrogenase
MGTNEEVVVDSHTLWTLARGILAASNVPVEKAEVVADSLIAANLRGVDSHGVHLLAHYIKQLRMGNIDADAEGHVVSESGSCLVYDGEHGIGQYISDKCCAHAVRLARQHGTSLVIARNSNHFGAAAFWAQRMSETGVIGTVMCSASPAVPPWQGRDGRIGTNPLCVSVPSSGRGRWLLDMATTTVARSRIVRAAANREASIPAGWATDVEGVPTTDPQRALEGHPMPLGGYKGSGLAMMVEMLCAVLGGGAISTEAGGLFITDRPMNTSQLFQAIDVARFLPLPQFEARSEHLVDSVKSARPARGYNEVLVAGDPEWRMEETRRREGIPVDPATWQRLAELAGELGVPLP